MSNQRDASTQQENFGSFFTENLIKIICCLYNGREQVHRDEHNILKLTHKVDINIDFMRISLPQ